MSGQSSLLVQHQRPAITAQHPIETPEPARPTAPRPGHQTENHPGHGSENSHLEVDRSAGIRAWEESVIPGMLQAADYARAIFLRYAERSGGCRG
ncbi:Scr1 family TA system antitoxin-like transcriptional regulator [Streptomyces sp. NPDC005989]|uniref:Scr1 family TA system antitoxin-like transcriptional regulator n=1 Tax=Streptomyces sp. NPDC005989 TaxID=3156727 RepID=UPI0033E65C05